MLYTLKDLGTSEGVREWAIVDKASGDWIGSIERERPFRAFGRRLTMRDTSKPYQWTVNVQGEHVPVPDGATLAEVREAVADALYRAETNRAAQRARAMIDAHGAPDTAREARALFAAVFGRAPTRRDGATLTEVRSAITDALYRAAR